jgi:hypothetical protein
MKYSQFVLFTKYLYGHQTKEYDMGCNAKTDKGSAYTILTRNMEGNHIWLLVGGRIPFIIYITWLRGLRNGFSYMWMNCQYHVQFNLILSTISWCFLLYA